MDIYYKTGILRNKTFLGNCIHMEKDELSLMKKTNSKIVYCPASNLNLKSGLMPAKKYVKEKLEFGIGTDIAGSPNISMFDTLRVSLKNEKSNLNSEKLLYLLTYYNTKLLGLENKIGLIERGLEATFFTLKEKSYSNKKSEIIEKAVKTGSSKNISNVFIQGKNTNF